MKAQLKFIMSTGFFKTFICLLIVFLTLPQSAIAVEAEWSKISKNEYIYGYEDKKFACWSLSDKTNLPFIEVLDNGNWYKAADGILLPANSSLETSCTAEFPTAIGYKWSVLRPAPPTNGANRYNIIYRQSLAEIVKITPYSEFEKYMEEVSVPYTEIETYFEEELVPQDILVKKKVPYYVKKTIKGKKKNVLQYKVVTVKEQVFVKKSVQKERPITKYRKENVERLKQVIKENKTITPGIKTEPGSIAVYSSLSAMSAYVSDITSTILCDFGFKENCKK